MVGPCTGELWQSRRVLCRVCWKGEQAGGEEPGEGGYLSCAREAQQGPQGPSHRRDLAELEKPKACSCSQATHSTCGDREGAEEEVFLRTGQRLTYSQRVGGGLRKAGPGWRHELREARQLRGVALLEFLDGLIGTAGQQQANGGARTRHYSSSRPGSPSSARRPNRRRSPRWSRTSWSRIVSPTRRKRRRSRA